MWIGATQVARWVRFLLSHQRPGANESARARRPIPRDPHVRFQLKVLSIATFWNPIFAPPLTAPLGYFAAGTLIFRTTPAKRLAPGYSSIFLWSSRFLAPYLSSRAFLSASVSLRPSIFLSAATTRWSAAISFSLP